MNYAQLSGILDSVKIRGIRAIPRGGALSLIWPILGCAIGQGMGFGLLVLNRVYNFYVFVLNRVCILFYTGT